MSLFLLLPALALAQPPAASTVSGVDKASMDTSVDPCVDFHKYACGNWMASHPLPADRARFGRFNELQDHNERVELDILQGAAAGTGKRSEIDQKIGDFYTSCMDTATINKKGIDPIRPELARIAKLTDMAGIVAEVAWLHRMGVPVVFGFGAQPDPKDSNKTIAGLRQSGLALPDRDYYLKQDAKSVEIRQHYMQHVQNMFKLAGDTEQAAAVKATWRSSGSK